MSGDIRPQSSQLAESLWTDPGIGVELVCELISTLKEKKKAEGGGNYVYSGVDLVHVCNVKLLLQVGAMWCVHCTYLRHGLLMSTPWNPLSSSLSHRTDSVR